MTTHIKEKPGFVCLGVISNVHGIQGEVVIQSYTQDPDDIAAYGPLQFHDSSKTIEILKLRPSQKGLIARLKGVTNRNQAEELKGQALYVAEDALPDIDEEETWYHADLIGLKAYENKAYENKAYENNVLIGEVVAVPNYGAGDLIEIKLIDSPKTLLLPFTKACVPEVNIKEGRVTLCLPTLEEGESDETAESQSAQETP